MTNFVTFEPNAPAPMHHHVEQQIAIIVSGELTFTVGAETRVMRAGECVVIPPGAIHKLTNTGDGPLKLLCCCAPPYSDADTVLTGG